MLDRPSTEQDKLYLEAATSYGAALGRLVQAYEIENDRRNDLFQDIHLALWRSFENYEARCSLRTWVYRVAHNIAASYVIRQRRAHSSKWTSLEELESAPDPHDHAATVDRNLAFQRLMHLIHELRPLDRQLMLLYLEDMDASSIGEIAGMSAGHVRIQIHRIKAILTRQFHTGKKS